MNFGTGSVTNRLNKNMEWGKGSTPRQSSERKVEAKGTTLRSCYNPSTSFGGAPQDAAPDAYVVHEGSVGAVEILDLVFLFVAQDPGMLAGYVGDVQDDVASAVAAQGERFLVETDKPGRMIGDFHPDVAFMPGGYFIVQFLNGNGHGTGKGLGVANIPSRSRLLSHDLLPNGFLDGHGPTIRRLVSNCQCIVWLKKAGPDQGLAGGLPGGMIRPSMIEYAM